MEGTLKNRLLILLTQKEQKENRRIRQKEIAQAVNVTKHTIRSWMRNEVGKFEGLCK
jgi:predicted XRE-type DNA-binding protein